MNLADIFAAIDRAKRNFAGGWQLPEATISNGGLGYGSRLQAAEANAPIHFDPSGFMGSTATVGRTLGDIAAGAAPAIRNAVVRFKGQLYEAPTHIQAIKQAIADGNVTFVNGAPKLTGDDSINLFRTDAGDLITRDQALGQLGASRTEDLRTQGDMPPRD